MGWTLAPHTGFCETGGELVFLDLVRDKYLALRGEDRAAFERLRAGEPNDSDMMTRLVATGLLGRCDGPTSIEPASVEIPSRDLAAARYNGFDLRMTVAAGLALRRARRAMRPERIAQSIKQARRRRSMIEQECDENAAEATAASYAANRWLHPVSQRCLIDALALDDIMLARGLRSTLVFGVRLLPFRAHCWLQTSSVILSGTAAEARNFVPILVVK